MWPVAPAGQVVLISDWRPRCGDGDHRPGPGPADRIPRYPAVPATSRWWIRPPPTSSSAPEPRGLWWCRTLLIAFAASSDCSPCAPIPPAPATTPRPPPIASSRIRGARRGTTQNLSSTSPPRTRGGDDVSGSGEISLVFDTLYAEGQRRYVETFSPFARQFSTGWTSPRWTASTACRQPSPSIRPTRCAPPPTVGTMTELADHFQAALRPRRAPALPRLRQAGDADTPATIFADIAARAAAAGDPRLVVSFPVTVPANFGEDEVAELLALPGLHPHPRPRRRGAPRGAGPLPPR